MFRILFDAHSYWRWVVLLTGLGSLVTSASAWLGGRPPSASSRRWDLWFVIAVDLQLTLGVVLWLGFSPYLKLLRAHPHDAMKNHAVRYWGMEHALAMIIGVAIVHIGRILAKRRPVEARPRIQAISVALWLVLVLLMFPWPGLSYGRELLRAP